MKLPAPIRALRPHQWVKNIFVLAAMAFAIVERGSLSLRGLEDQLLQTALAFFAFCLGASTIYLVNDVMDVESDRKHPTKCRRPIAAGEISIPFALGLALVCFVGAISLGSAAGGVPITVCWIVLAYMVMNFAYSVRLKHVVLVDAFIIATGFLLRVVAGGLAARAVMSNWLFLCTFFLALFLALCKRRAEIDLLGDEKGGHRAILDEYTLGFLDQMVTVLAACTIITYTMWTVSEETVAKFGHDDLVWTVPFVVFGLGRYLLLVQTQRGGGSPTKVLLGGDITFVLNAFAWLGAVVLATVGRTWLVP